MNNEVLENFRCKTQPINKTIMNAFIHWNNGYITRVGAYYNESINAFEIRVLKSYGKYDCRIILSIREGEEGFYIK